MDSLLSRLDILSERIRASEHLVNLDLDSKRNALVALGLALDLLLVGFEAHMVITGGAARGGCPPACCPLGRLPACMAGWLAAGLLVTACDCPPACPPASRPRARLSP